ncbi:MAG: di-trans,poly-cis-decaprenylcistransferase [Cycloclasticus sp. symbiont of Poecilosclerida sp. N]|nr:MAG: di-trans,poly-cis-decaprenylcistransferase [Cycloclasticus sp. symbiont of Poecilosclerida sp. N]
MLDGLNSFNQSDIPKHIAIVMDGNGRWAQQRNKPRTYGHKAGVDALRETIESCAEIGVEALTVFAFSSENWLRPVKEVDVLMNLFMVTLKSQAKRLHKNNIRLLVIGDRSRFSGSLRNKIKEVELLTASNSGMSLVIAANYGGHWDIEQAAHKMVQKSLDSNVPISKLNLEDYLSTSGLPTLDLFIRTGGEKRVSNFLLWQIAYSELYFTDTLWPDFDKQDLVSAIESFSSRHRRFGKTDEQIDQST